MLYVVRVNLAAWVLQFSELSVVDLVLLEDAELRVDADDILRYSSVVGVALQVLQIELFYVEPSQAQIRQVCECL